MAKMDTLIMYLSLAAFIWLLYTYVLILSPHLPPL